jgi:hypothetical protein
LRRAPSRRRDRGKSDDRGGGRFAGNEGGGHRGKLAGYFTVPSVEHYLIVDLVLRTIVHHRRAGEVIETRIASEGTLRLDPPGLDLPVGDLFAEP